MRCFVALLFAVALAGQTPFHFPDPVDRLEATVTKNPTDTNATIDLLQRYSGLLNNPEMPVDKILEARRRYILWLIEHSPDSGALTIPAAGIDPKGPPADPEGYAKAAELWRQQASKPDANAKTIANAVYFFRGTDRGLSFAMLDGALKTHPGDADLMRVRGALDATVMVGATRIDNVGLVASSDPVQRKSSEASGARQEIETSSNGPLVAAASEFMFQNFGFLTREAFLGEDPLVLAERWAARARDLESGNPGRTDFLITVLQRESDASLDPREKARYFEKALASANTDPQRIRVLLILANLEFEARDDAAAERSARQLLDLAASNPKAGNHDDLVHTGHMILGRVALARGEKEEAKNQLLESARVKGSPGLRNGGPKMLLAQDLLDAGERETVLQYLDLCRAFWNNDQGKLERFVQAVHSGGKDLLAAAFAPPRPSQRTPLAQPAQLTPANGAVLDLDADKKITLAWTPVMGADSYIVEWDCRDAKGWQSERDAGLVRVIPTRETTATFDFAGVRQGRWRVYAVSARTGAGRTSDWREFRLMEPGDLPDRAEADLDAGDVNAAERDTRRLLQLAQENPKGWNHDDLAHAAHTLLGRIALRHGDLNAAKEQLFASARLENAPGVSSLGPSMKLAQEILAAGDRDAVLRYLEMCRSFWKTDRGRLDRYVSLVKNESAPNLLLPYSSQGATFTGGKAPAFKLKDLAGKTRNSEEFSGKTVVIDFWATWCVPCREELAALERLAREFRSSGMLVIAVNVGENEATVRAFASKNNIGLPVLLAGEDEMVLSYRVTAFPTLAVIDRSGQIVDYRIGDATENELRQMFESAVINNRGN
jgi:thiol-disulfide isomerase/thioredoxin